MITYAIVTLTDPENFSSAHIIEVQYGTEILGIPSELVRSFVECTNNACATFLTHTEEEVLEVGLKLIPPPFHPVFRHLYEEMKDKI